MTKVAVLDDYQDCARTMGPWARLGDRVELTVFTEHVDDERAAAGLLEPFDIVVMMRERTPFTRSLFERLPNLRQLVTTGPFNAAIDMQAAADHDVLVSATGFSLSSTVELTWGLLFAVTRHLVDEDRAVREGGWQHTVGPELDGRTLGLVGLGNTGKMMVPIARCFGLEVIAWSQNLRAEDAQAVGVRAVSKAELFEQADFVSVHYKLSERSLGIVGAEDLARMKPTAFLINISRGPLVDERALVQALREERIAGAALDVYDVEPLPADDPLRGLPRTVLSPHIGYVATTQYESWWRDVVEDIESFLDGTPVRVIGEAKTPAT
jgi:phosphoglycerate dehydrogenase-like enzyme